MTDEEKGMAAEDEKDAATSKADPPARRMAHAVEKRKVPEGCTREVVPGDGSSLYHAVSRALAAAKRKNKACPPQQLRAEAIAHMRKYSKD